VIAAHVVDGWVIDPGPGLTLERLVEGLDEPPRGVLLTHIHLDHAGGAGGLARRFPGVPVHIHPVGATHMVDPSRLWLSAGRLFGPENMDRLWGPIVPLDQRSVVPVADRQAIGPFVAFYTPGHAGHHIAYLHQPTGMLFTGDVAGVTVEPGVAPVMPTPPPEIDLSTWRDSIDILESIGAVSIHLAHFGQVADPAGHLAAAREELDRIEAAAREGEDAFARHVADRYAQTPGRWRESLELAAPPGHLYPGVARYLSRKPRNDATAGNS